MREDFECLAEGRTLILFDLRNRGRSETIADAAKLAGGIHNDVEDLEAVRRHFGFDKIDLLGHSYVGLTVVLYAMKYPGQTNRVIQIGPAQPRADKQYPAHLTGADPILTEVLGKLAQLQNEPAAPDQRCRKSWALLRMLYVADPADADKLHWEPCDLLNELNFMSYWMGHVLPSIRNLHLSSEQLGQVRTPVLTIHGTKDRSAAYGGARDWAMQLPNARLITIENAAHVPWVEAPEIVFGAIAEFLSGRWPAAARRVESLEPA